MLPKNSELKNVKQSQDFKERIKQFFNMINMVGHDRSFPSINHSTMTIYGYKSICNFGCFYNISKKFII